MQTLWSGSIAFGLVNIPVKLHSAVGSEEIKFHSLSKDDHSPIRYKRVAESTGKEVPFKDIVKGYEYEKGRFVIIDNADFDKVRPTKSGAIDILQFSQLGEVDPLLFEKPYYLAPAKGGGKTYALLQQALEKSGLVGVASFPLRQRTHICLLRAYKGRLVLAQLRYAEELRALPSLEENMTVSDKELQLALQLVKQLSAPFDAAQFHDPYVQELRAVIEAKARGRKLKAAPAAAPKDAGVKDLMEVLKASIGKKKRA
ncbi:Ku protein [Flaviaesturariibacter aridisoli]|uniref:Non-homologous end joining protein Ku n=1 Tax=Flaviaesturariibacter aridisoli TaxID=2545761 RepID=A0A4R4E062_9BACT|nr:Ku protein [Flaviaesturariibacter aridisoli]TCZ70515.1 Ku protein [Flaviaesturariibacter aridisoli]